MNRADGHQIIETRNRNSIATVECTRWEEIKECVSYHAHIAALFNAPTVFSGYWLDLNESVLQREVKNTLKKISET